VLPQYYNRWSNHEQSAKLSLKLYSKTEKKMQNMQITSDLTWIEVQFMKKAVDEVEQCRMTLKWTYAMAYYLDKGNEKELFEDNQRFVSGFFWIWIGICLLGADFWGLVG
jgi:ariadne-1